MNITPKATAKQVSVMAISAALYAVFFVLSKLVPGLPSFTVLYLPVILLGIFPIWFGWSGLFGSMIGALIGGIFAESLPLNIAWAEAATTFIIYTLNWLIIPKIAAECKTKKGLILLCAAYAPTLFIGTSYILWQLSYFGIPIGIIWITLLATYALNFPIMLLTCPAILKATSPKLKNWGLYSGTFSEWLSNRKTSPDKN